MRQKLIAQRKKDQGFFKKKNKFSKKRDITQIWLILVNLFGDDKSAPVKPPPKKRADSITKDFQNLSKFWMMVWDQTILYLVIQKYHGRLTLCCAEETRLHAFLCMVKISTIWAFVRHCYFDAKKNNDFNFTPKTPIKKYQMVLVVLSMISLLIEMQRVHRKIWLSPNIFLKDVPEATKEIREMSSH